MKVFDRYLAREVLGYTALGLGVFLFILLTPEVLRLSELLARENIAASQLAALFLSILPEKLLWAVPLSILAGLLLGVSRLAADCEILALKATGVNPAALLRPALLLAGLGAALALATSLWWLPAAAQTTRQLQREVAPGQLSYEVEPRVFDERFPDVILYVQDTARGGTEWRGVFLADVSKPGVSKVTLAERAVAAPEPGRGVLQLQLNRGTVHTYDSSAPDRYSVSTFEQNLLNIKLPDTSPNLRVPHHNDLSLAQLWDATRTSPNSRILRADFHRRLALPAACLVFALAALPLGLLAERSGRAIGFVASIALALAYYLVFLLGDRLAREGNLPPAAGVWLANIVFLFVFPLYFQRHTGELVESLVSAVRGFPRRLQSLFRRPKQQAGRNHLLPQRAQRQDGASPSRLPFTLDLYVAREILFYSVLLTAGLLLVFGLFSIMEMVDDIAANKVAWSVVLRFLWYLLPQAFYLMSPLALLLGILVSLALLSKRNELVAIKSAGISLYRVALPVTVIGLCLSGFLFWLDQTYLPKANQRQDMLRNQIRGRAPQTFRFTERHWIFGEEPRIYHYAFFDPDENLLAELNVLELDPLDFSLRRRLHAGRAHWNARLKSWVLEDGWERIFDRGEAQQFERFQVQNFAELTEPPTYFRREIRESEQMSWGELRRYINDLKQSGFEVTRLLVQWHRKLAFPLLAAIITLLAFPFGTTMGNRGAVGGLALGIGLGFLYWVLSGFFEALGNISMLPPLLAAWGPNLIFLFAGSYLFLQVDT